MEQIMGESNKGKYKILIQVGLTESGELHAQCTTKNVLTAMGMLELAKNVIKENFDAGSKKSESRIFIPTMGANGR
jgi:hypothetical protein